MTIEVDESTGEVLSQPKPFTQFLIEQRGGGLHGELSERLAELVAAVAEHGRSGSMTLTINVAPAGKGMSQFIVADDVKLKAPQPERGASLFFADGQGNLSRSDPRQPELPLREVAEQTPTIREAR